MVIIIISSLAGIGGSPEDDEGPGVYLHILKARQESTQPFYLYVGQASSLCLRIKDHNDRSYRKRHPCLHYRVWDLLQSACLLYESIFVKLVDLGSVLSYGVAEQRHLIINLSEMFMACALQTLRKRDLHIYLPETLRKPWADRHLNLALPLWQGLSEDPKDMRMSKASFEEALHSLDPVIRDWAVGVRNAYQSLRDHPDPRVREYWMSNFRSIQEFDGVDKAYMTAQKAAHEAALQFLTNGADCRIYQVGHGYYMAQYSIYQFSLGSMFDRWSLKDKVAGKHGLVRGKTVFVKPFLLNEPNPLRYAQHALPIDPSGRLVVAASENGGMNGKLVFLFGSQEKQAMRLNRLVDTMEGLSFHESECLARRGIRKKRKWIYTTETLPDVSCP